MTARTPADSRRTEARTSPFPPILVTGGTGTLGRQVIARLTARGLRARALSRHPGDDTDLVEYCTGDLDTGAGVGAAVKGVLLVIHCAGARVGDDRKAATLVAAARPAGVQHLVNISVVGADRVPVKSSIDRAMFGYFASKLAAEAVIAGSGIPWTTLRATQFHELVLITARAMAKLPVVPVPAARFQPVAGAEVAERLVELALGEPAGLAPDIAGPRIYPMRDLVRSYVQARGLHRVLLPMRMPGAAARAVRAGANLAPESATGRETWEAFLAAQDLGGVRRQVTPSSAGAATG
ncbi:MAG: NAD(P)H-binding protein [Candidatus Dormibacteraeota bacterium]|nr:NAD(P)H-binding protein [Candidatus Dormibacteraeota bacterium]